MHHRVYFWLCLVCLVLPCTALGHGQPADPQPAPLTFHLDFPAPLVQTDGANSQITAQAAPGCLAVPGQAILPKYTVTVTLPFGTRVATVSVQSSPACTFRLLTPPVRAPYPTGLSLSDATTQDPSAVIPTRYPSQQVYYQTGTGLDRNDTHVTFLTLIVIPGQYQAATNTLHWVSNWTISLSYTVPDHSPFSAGGGSELVIIAPSQFARILTSLVAHKQAMGISTTLKTTTDIYKEYFAKDHAEQIKLFIKDAVENWGTRYVLLVGGLKSIVYGVPRDSLSIGATDWQIPVRYSNLWDLSTPRDPGFISDLYYADLYNSQGQYSSWDTNGDGVYGGWDNPNTDESRPIDVPGTDTLDFYPDVYVGRLPCRNFLECRTMVQKIIAYETTPADPSWFMRAVVAAGDPYYDAGTNIYEGEAIGDEILSHLSDFYLIHLYASSRENYSQMTPLTRNILRELDEGCGFLILDGHGTPMWWNTCWPGECNSTIARGGLTVGDLRRLSNGERQPVVVIGGCHCCLFNVSLLVSLFDRSNGHASWTNGRPTPRCLGEVLMGKRDGGGIAVLGSTGLGYEQSGENGDLDGDGRNLPDCDEALGGFLEILFFRAYENGSRTLGQAWGQAISAYLDVYPGMLRRDDAKTVEQWVVLGDPSLRIGGYLSSQ